MTLAEQVELLKQKNASLVIANQDYVQQNKKLKEVCDTKDRRITELSTRVAWFERQYFGRKSERRLAIATDNQLCLGELPEVEEDPPDRKETVKSYGRRQRRKLPLKDAILEEGLRFGPEVPVEVIEIPNPDIEGLDASEYEIVSEKITHRLAQRPGSYVVLKYIRKVAKLKKTGKLICPPAPAAVLEKSYADVSFLAGLLVDKFCWHLPLYRQHQRLLDSGIQLSRATLTNFVHRSIHLLEPIYHALLSSILQSKVLMMDETPIKATRLKGKMKTGYFWPVYGDQHEIAFVFSNSRAAPVVREVLGSFAGTLLTDGYPVYAKHAETSEYTHAQCWAHARRKFVEAQDLEPKLSSKALDFIGKLYKYEAAVTVKAAYGPARIAYRKTHSQPVVDEFFNWLTKVFGKKALLPSSPFTKAANYALQRQKELSVFLHDPDVPIDTNDIERQLRPVALGRKNWLFCWSEVGARYAGIIYSIIRTCKLHSINPYDYLVDVLQRGDDHSIHDVHLLTPKLWKQNFAEEKLTSNVNHVDI